MKTAAAESQSSGDFRSAKRRQYLSKWDDDDLSKDDDVRKSGDGRHAHD